MANMDLDEEQEEQEEQKQQKSSGNVFNKASDSADNFAKEAKNFSEQLKRSSTKFQDKSKLLNETAKVNSGTAKGAQAAAKAGEYAQKAQKMAQAAEKMEKAAQVAGKFAELAAHLVTWLIWVIIIILIIIIIVGLLTFLITGWGMIMQAFKELVKGFYDVCFNIVKGGEENVKDEEIIDVMKDIESMGYDLYGYGFVTSGALKDVTTENDNGEKTTNTEMVYYEAPKEGEDGEFKLIKELEDKDAYRYITSYLISDNYAYFIKNHNFNFRTLTTSANHFLGGIFDRTLWGSGLISIYEQKGGHNEITGERGKAYGTIADNVQDGVALGIAGRCNGSRYSVQ